MGLNKQNILFSFLSLTSHLLLLVFAIVCVDFTDKVYKASEENILPSFLYKEISIQKHTKEILKPKIQKNEKSFNRDVAKHSSPKTENGFPIPELLAKLHAAIQQKQQYPESALQMEREGRVRVGFTLFTNGDVANLKILKSSGTNSLDQAALLAVNDAKPFKGVEKYLNTAQEYDIDVVFQLK